MGRNGLKSQAWTREGNPRGRCIITKKMMTAPEPEPLDLPDLPDPVEAAVLPEIPEPTLFVETDPFDILDEDAP